LIGFLCGLIFVDIATTIFTVGLGCPSKIVVVVVEWKINHERDGFLNGP
jgi:hypothetical protein